MSQSVGSRWWQGLVASACMGLLLGSSVQAQPRVPGAGAIFNPLLNKPDTITTRNRETVTSVDPLVVSPLAPIPNVGRGATYFTPEDLHADALQARKDDIDARAGALQCKMAVGVQRLRMEEYGDFDIGALLTTEGEKQAALQHAADAAAGATEAAMAARRAAVLGASNRQSLEATELARQQAVNAYQDAKAAMFEAQARIADLQDQVDLEVNGAPADPTMKCSGVSVANCDGELLRQIQAVVDNHSLERSQGDTRAGVYPPSEFRDLRLTNITSRQREEGGVTVIRVSGKIINPRRSDVAVPPIWVSAVDQFGTGLKSEQASAPRGQKAIKAGATLNFTYAMKPMPERTARTVVTFAPYHHPPRYKPVSAYCPL